MVSAVVIAVFICVVLLYAPREILISPFVRVSGLVAAVHIPLRLRESTPELIARGDVADVTVPPPPPPPPTSVRISVIIPLCSTFNKVKSPCERPLVKVLILY